jgi:hypothetical protein
MNLAEFIESRREQHLGELYEFICIPSVLAKSEPTGYRSGFKWVADRLQRGGSKSKSFTSLHPLVYAESL